MKKEDEIFKMESKKRLFPDMDPWKPENTELNARLYVEELLEKNSPGNSFMENNNVQNDKVPSGYTYLGQFIGHEISFQPRTLSAFFKLDESSQNLRTPKLDLDSIYGKGPVSDLSLYDQSLNFGRTHFYVDKELQITYGDKVFRLYDLPRKNHNENLNVAIVPDSRNDENLIIAQLHLAFLLFHNKIVESKCLKFNKIVRHVNEYTSMLNDGKKNRQLDKNEQNSLLHENRNVSIRDDTTSEMTKELSLEFNSLKEKNNLYKLVEFEFSSSINYFLRKLSIWKNKPENNIEPSQAELVDQAIEYVDNNDFSQLQKYLKKNEQDFRLVFQKVLDARTIRKIFKTSNDLEKSKNRFIRSLSSFEVKIRRIQMQFYERAFYETKKIVTWHFHWIILFDFLKKVVSPSLVHEILGFEIYEKPEKDHKTNRKVFFWHESPYIPLEFSVGAFRFGHSMVRDSYMVNEYTSQKGIFEMKRMNNTPKHFIDWRFFFESKKEQDRSIKSKGIDLFISQQMVEKLPLSEIEKNIVYRNLKRSVEFKLPGGHQVASELNELVVSVDFFKKKDKETFIALMNQFPEKLDFEKFCDNSPLWFYILMEAHLLEHGERLGPVGGRIVAEVLIGIIEGDKNSFLYQQPDWRPDFFDDCEVETPGDFTMVDLLKIAGVWKGAYVKEKDDCKPSNT